MRTLAILVLLALTGAGLLAWRQGVREAEREDAVETSRIRAWARSNSSAGISVLPKRVPPADEAELADLEDLPGFHEYAMRCSLSGAKPPGRRPNRHDTFRLYL